MRDPFRNEKIQNWAAEFAESDVMRDFPESLRERAQQIAESFLTAACESRDINPDALTDADTKAGLLDGVGRMPLPESAQACAPDLCAAFLNVLRSQGRLGGSTAVPAFLKALRGSFDARAAAARWTGQPADAKADVPAPAKPKLKPIVRPADKLGPNDPCPCGSGKKYKKCCKRQLG